MGLKAELIAKEKSGGFDGGKYVCCPAYSYQDAMVILDTPFGIDDYVFGYFQYMEGKKRYFLRKIEYHGDSTSFRWNGKRWNLNDFTIRHY